MVQEGDTIPASLLGQRIAHYEVQKKIGAGGMGEVYLARDSRLDREIALKVLPPEFSEDSDRRTGFEREARAVAALNHPQHRRPSSSIEEAGDVYFMTMELVRGQTLADLLPSSGVALRRFFEIAIPLADAVGAAHQQGITHRDLKLANVMVSTDGRVKVLDFGLAKATADAANGRGTLETVSMTREGHIVGTPAYMSPEQIVGQRVDSRSDIFSLGIAFYELLTGQRPFKGDTSASILSSILRDTPRALTDQQPAVPRELSRLVQRCLARDPIDRYQSAIDLRHDLEAIRQDLGSGELASSARVLASRQWWQTRLGVAAAAAIVVATGSLLILNRAEPVIPQMPIPRNAMQVTSALGIEANPNWSPDGVRLVYQATIDSVYPLIGNYDIWVAQPGSGEPVNLTKDNQANDRMPSWSPDGREIAFMSDRDGSWGVYLISALGGTARRVLSLPDADEFSASAPQWSNDATRLFVLVRQAGLNGVIVLSLQSLETTRVPLPALDGNVCWDLSVRPDGRRWAYVEGGAGATEITRLWTISASGGEPVALTDGRTNVWSPTWSSDGRRVFYVSNRGGSMDLWQQGVSDGGTPVGKPLAVTQGLGIRSAAFSPDGAKLTYARGGMVANVWRAPIGLDRPITWNDAVQLTSEHAYIEFVDVSSDGTQLALSSDRRGNQDIWLMPAAGGEMTPLTNDPTPDWDPHWSPDGSQIAFYAYRSGNRDIWVIPSRGGPARQLTSLPAQDTSPTWSPDGLELAFFSRKTTPPSVGIVDPKGGEPRFIGTGNGGHWSPDGRWLAVIQEGRLHRIARDGSKLETPPPIAGPASWARVSSDGQSINYSVIGGPREALGLWKLRLADGVNSRLTQLEGRRGALGYVFTTDEHFVYFTWNEADGDIWVMNLGVDTKK